MEEKKTGQSIEALQEQVSAAAKNYFKSGLNCGEAVVKAFLDLGLTDYPPEIVALSTGFGGGIGMTKNTCGAVLGGVMVIGAMKGRKDPLERETLSERVSQLQTEIYPIFRTFVSTFTDQYGSVVCKELSDPYGSFEGKERKRNCMQMIMQAAAIATRLALEPEEAL